MLDVVTFESISCRYFQVQVTRETLENIVENYECFKQEGDISTIVFDGSDIRDKAAIAEFASKTGMSEDLVLKYVSDELVLFYC